ncbi:hypothetical protein [Microcoleus sp. D2_18a_D3]|uniref:hypothetical protein n=1 Tax=Microcoleus sp. D2_18a_D3 TaxID=3055330 RepID=UPI002FD16610
MKEEGRRKREEGRRKKKQGSITFGQQMRSFLIPTSEFTLSNIKSQIAIPISSLKSKI